MKKEKAAQQIPLAIQNHLFMAMQEEVKDRLLPLMEPILLNRDEILYKPDSTLEYIYFPIDAIVALIFVTSKGSTVEFSVVGNEGIVGIITLLSGEGTFTKGYVMSAGFAYKLPIQAMQDELYLNNKTLLLFLRYLQTVMTQMSLTAVCNRHHTIEQQFCKLLLLALDRLPCNNLSLTQELVSVLLGVRREGITEAAVKLQKLGIIEYHRGHITVLDRTKLEKLSCECYEILFDEANRLLPLQPINLPFAAAYAARPSSFIDPKCVHCFKFGSCTFLKNNLQQATQKCITFPVRE